LANPELRFRWVHLDFHTSEDIPAVGAAFDPDEFASTLERARVNSITCFARCHHGWLYFDSHAFPERRHPTLTRDLLREQIAACHARDIRVPIYTTVQWDHYTANEHPEWLCLDEHGCIIGTPPFEPGFYRRLCVNSPYRDFLKTHVQEILEMLPTDGLFFDIVMPTPCACRYCRAAMEARGLDPADAAARERFALETINEFKRDMTAFIRRLNSECSIYYNAGHIGTRHREVAAAYSHFELETLPSGGWGYQHFPITMRYARNLGLDCLGYTGKFHTTWGDFHSFKNPAALQYECFRMLALGAKVGVGDQLHPSGRIDPYVYDLIGSVYREVERKEPWCRGARPVVDIGVFTPEEFYGAAVGSLPQALIGVTRMLDEAGHQYDVIDSQSDLGRYRILVLPDRIPVSPELAQKLERYLAAGGKLIASFESGLNPEQTAFLPALGVTLSPNPARTLDGRLARGRDLPRHAYCDYILPQGAIGQGLPPTEHAMYRKGVEVTACPGAEVLAPTVLSYFDRTYKHFCSHLQTPSSGQPGYPAIVRQGNAIYFAHPLFTLYGQSAPRWCRQLFLNALGLLLPEPLLRHNGPSTVLAAVNEQAAERRRVLHLLHYIPERRAQEIDIIEDVIPLYDLTISLRTPGQVAAVRCVPGGQSLPYAQAGGRIEFTVPKVVGHQMVSVELL